MNDALSAIQNKRLTQREDAEEYRILRSTLICKLKKITSEKNRQTDHIISRGKVQVLKSSSTLGLHHNVT